MRWLRSGDRAGHVDHLIGNAPHSAAHELCVQTGGRMTESQIQDAVRLELGDIARYPELVLWRNNVGQMVSADGRRIVFGVGGKGAADLLGMFGGRFVAIEIKTPIGRQSPEQKRFQALVEMRGGAYALIRSVDDARQWAADMRRTA